MINIKTLTAAFALSCFSAFCGAEMAKDDFKEQTNPAAYSAGSMSAAEIQTWFKDNINPAEFDIWFGKKDRQYLNGSWKLMLLAPEKPVKFVYNSEHQLVPDSKIAESDIGERKGFYKTDFDDSKWLNQPVPFPWMIKFDPDTQVGKPVSQTPILGWYRKHFTVPESWSGKRILLTFRAVTFKCDVYVNGVKIGSNEESRPNISGWMARLHTEECFSFDITENVKFEQKNVLAVKVFSPCPGGGIWQEVYLDAVPNIYIEKALVTPDSAEKQIKVKAFVVNTTGKEMTISPSATLAPWKSERYKIADWLEETTNLPEFALKPGNNEIVFNVPVKKPHYWSPEHPNLYLLIIRDQHGNIMGQERFGFRTITVGKSMFMLNGKPIFLRSENNAGGSWTFPGTLVLIEGFGILNRGRVIEKTWRKYMSAGFNMSRNQAYHPPHVLMDIADELGLLMYNEESPLDVHKGVARLENGEAVLTEKYKEAIKRRTIEQYNNPSVIILGCHNECYDSYALNQPMWQKTGFGPVLRAIYDETKKYDRTRPITASSGRGPTQPVLSPITMQKNKSDFDDGHLYSVLYDIKSAENDDWRFSYKKCKEAYTKDNDGKERAMLDGETFWFFSDSSTISGKKPFQTRQKDFLPHLNPSGEFDREWLAENLKSSEQKAKYDMYEYSMIPFNVSADEDQCLRVQGKVLQMMMELERRKRKYVAGYVYHFPAIFMTFPRNEPVPLPHTYEAAKKAQQSVLICLDGLFNRNMIAGKTTKTKLYLINDTEEELPPSKAALSMRYSLGERPVQFAEFSFAPVKPGEMAVKEISLIPPTKLRSGHYQLILETFSRGATLSRNDYDLYLLNPADMKVETKMTPTVFAPGSGAKVLTDILDQLNVKFETIKSLDKLSADTKVLLIPPNTWPQNSDSEVLRSWVQKGGKVLAFEQKNFIKGFIPGRLRPVGAGCWNSNCLGWFTELVLLTHPIYKNLCQDDFYFWSGDGVNPDTMKIVSDAFIPLNKGVLSMLITTSSRMGISACEAKHGKGRFLFSQLKALSRFGTDSVATKYTLNMLDYALNGFDDPRAPLLEKQTKKADAYNVDTSKTFFVDLKPIANMGFADEVEYDQKGGWSDQGPEKDARSMPLGKQTFAGVPFEIINPAENNGKSCVVLQGDLQTKTAFLPKKSQRIPINKKARKLYFLFAAAWTPPYYMRKPDESMASLFINMNITSKSGGTFARSEIKLIPAKNFSDWQKPKEVPDALIGWRGTAGPKDMLNETVAYVIEWINPEPVVEIGWIDFESAGRAVPILIAITGESE